MTCAVHEPARPDSKLITVLIDFLPFNMQHLVLKD